MVSDSDIKKLAQLARLELSDEDRSKVGKKISSTIEYVNQLMEINVEDIEPTSHVHGIANVLRSDEVKPSLPIEDLKSIAPEMNGRFIKVPLVVE